MVHENRHLINCLRDYDYDTLLMRAVLFDDDVFDYLIEKPQDFSIVNRYNWNIIHYIVLYGNDDEKCESQMIKLSHKTNVESLINERDVDGRTPLHHAARKNKHRTIAWSVSYTHLTLPTIYSV